MKLLKISLKIFLPLLAVVFVLTAIFTPVTASNCLTENFCLSVREMGYFYYVFAISVLTTLLIILFSIIADLTWFLTWAAILKKPYLTWSVVGGGIFTALGLANLFLKKTADFTNFQVPFVPYVATFNFIIAGIIVAACIIKSRNKNQYPKIYAVLIAILIFNGLFINMLTLPTGIYSWNEFLPFAIITGIIDLLVIYSTVRLKSQKWTKK